MALPSKSDIGQLTFSLDGGPWCRAAAKDSITVSGLNYSLDGSPWSTSCIASSPGITILAYFGATPITKIYHGTTPITALHLNAP